VFNRLGHRSGIKSRGEEGEEEGRIRNKKERKDSSTQFLLPFALP